MNLLSKFPDAQELITRAQKNANLNDIPEVNGHIHTPYSFSAFNNIKEIFSQAKQEKIAVAGINDFYVTDGYTEFYDLSVQNKIFPIFGIEFIGLLKEEQEKGIRINDPNNPGRIYFCGKALSYPSVLPAHLQKIMSDLKSESLRQVKLMTDKVNEILREENLEFRISFELIKINYAKDLVRERHVAKAIRIGIFECYLSESERKEALKKLYGGKETAVKISNEAALEIEIRNNLLKAGGRAFVEEDPKAFLNIEQIKEIIIAAGGIPCYPVLLDDKSGNFTDYEKNWEQLKNELVQKDVYCVELIPGRNQLEILREFVQYFEKQGFIVTLGTEHNTPERIPLMVDTRGSIPIDEYLKRISYEGCCVYAAHQYLLAQGAEGYLDKNGKAKTDKKAEMIQLGNAVIAYFRAQ